MFTFGGKMLLPFMIKLIGILKHTKLLRERDDWEDQDVDGWTILKWMLER
jgi:hypothetical protein